MPFSDKTLQRASSEKHRDKLRQSPEGRAKLASYTKKLADTRRAEIAKLKNQPCVDCGNTFAPVCMDWDHREGTTKFKNVSAMWTYSMDKILAEIAKCDLVCANCHRLRTAKRNTGNANWYT